METSRRVMGWMLAIWGASTWAEPPSPPRMSQAEAMQLLAAAGFRFGDGTALNSCGKPAAPRFGFLDLNGDGRPEALVVDRSTACYGTGGEWFGILMREENGQWRAVIREAGTVRWEKTRTRGWVDARVESGGCPRLARYDGRNYVVDNRCTKGAAAPRPAAADGKPALAPAERQAAFKAAGFIPRGDRQMGCDSDSTRPPSRIDFEVLDLNRDGQPEVLIREGNGTCYGQTGAAFYLVTREASGRWRRIAFEMGIPRVLASRQDGWPDIEAEGPGSGKMPVIRWDGKAYASGPLGR